MRSTTAKNKYKKSKEKEKKDLKRRITALTFQSPSHLLILILFLFLFLFLRYPTSRCRRLCGVSSTVRKRRKITKKGANDHDKRDETATVSSGRVQNLSDSL